MVELNRTKLNKAKLNKATLDIILNTDQEIENLSTLLPQRVVQQNLLVLLLPGHIKQENQINQETQIEQKT